MSRHRNVRKVSVVDDDYDDDLSQSFDEKYSYAVSPGTSEMYMFNRHQQNMSEFIQGKIQEEDDDKLETKIESNSQQKDEDFMFQMDKEPNQLKTSVKQPDDLDSLILNSMKLKFDEHDTTLTQDDDMNEEEDGKQFDLSSLAKMYQSTDDSKPLEIKFDDQNPIDNVDIMSTSIDKLLDNFFLNTFQDKTFQRTKSISFSENKVTESKKPDPNAFSLSDLATEYLSTMTPTSTQTPLGSSLADMIDYEFNHRLSINEDYEDKKVDLKENILINKRDRNSSSRFSIGSDLVSSPVSSSTSLTKMEPISLNKIQFVPVVRETGPEFQIETLFSFNETSVIADFLSEKSNVKQNESNLVFEDEFSFVKQKKFSDQNRPKRHKILIDLTNEQSKKVAKKTNPKTKSTPSSSSNVIVKIKAFDFSIPSPDDIILAKQKFAFKNMRFK